MKAHWLGVMVLMMVAWLGLTSGCTAPGAQYYQGNSSESSIRNVPSSFYDNNPSVEDWYTAPYWNPDAD